MEFGHFSDKKLPSIFGVPADDGATYTVNSSGYRCPEWEPMPDGKKNAVILGCSHVFGQGLNDDEHWAHMISQHNTDRIRYWNLGSPGASCDKVVRILYGCEKIIDPRIIIVCWPERSRREKLLSYSTGNLHGRDEEMRFETDETDQQNFLKNVFLVEKYAEKMNCKTFHCFSADSYHEGMNVEHVLEEQTLTNCWPWWDTYRQRELHSDSKARDGKHHGVEHHQRFSELFLESFGVRLR